MTHALVIDDNAPNLKVLAQLLTREGLQVSRISDPKAVVEALSQLESIDVVFLDLEMPGLNGYEVKNLIREQSHQTLIIACTVHTGEITMVKHAGFDGFLGKPLSPEAFPGQLTRILRGEPVWEVTH